MITTIFKKKGDEFVLWILFFMSFEFNREISSPF